jgi:bifunctional DNase/RNase
MSIEMKVRALSFDPESNTFVVFLSDVDGRYALPIWIGPFEANAIVLRLKDTRLPRPMTHELVQNILEAFDSEVLKIEVMDLKDNTYHALIYVLADGKEHTIDSRPSDAIAIALGTGAPIYVREELLGKSKTIRLDKDMDEEEMGKLLESLDPEDFEYKA